MPRTRQRHAFACSSATLCVELQAAAHETARLLEFGGEVAVRRAAVMSAHLVRTAVTLRQQLAEDKERAA